MVLDLVMPVMNGFEAVLVLQRQMPKVPVVILTMHTDHEQFGASLAHTFGVQAIIPKSSGMKALVHCVQKLLA